MKRDDPELLKLLGLTEEEARDPGRAMFSGGIDKLFKVLRFMHMPAELGPDGMGGCPETGQRVPPWQSMTGLFPDTAENMAPDLREEKARNLIDIVLHYLRYEMNAEKQTPQVYHTIQWDPLPKICEQLRIARVELSRQSKLATGLAAHELVDVIRIRDVKEKMKVHVREFLAAINEERGQLASHGARASSPAAQSLDPHAGGTPAPQSAVEVWKLLREARKGPHFHRGQWALTLGFPNHARLYRACMVYFQLAPQQLELMAIEEVLDEMKSEKGEIKKDGSVEADTSDSSVIKEGGDAPPEKTAAERLTQIVWNQMKARHVQFFADISEQVWAEAS